MPGHNRDKYERVPEFYLSPAANGCSIDPEVSTALAKLWPWFWGHVGQQLGDSDRAADLADEVATRVSQYVQTHPGEVRSVLALCRVAATNIVISAKMRNRRIDYRGLSQDIEGSFAPTTPSWEGEIELSIWIDQILQREDDIRQMLRLRLLDHTWDQIGKLFGLTAGQARLRFYRALQQTQDPLFNRPNRGGSL